MESYAANHSALVTITARDGMSQSMFFLWICSRFQGDDIIQLQESDQATARRLLLWW
jgi:hypothetical protein